MTERYVSDPGSPTVEPDVQGMDVETDGPVLESSSSKEYHLDPYEPLQTIYSEEVNYAVKISKNFVEILIMFVKNKPLFSKN